MFHQSVQNLLWHPVLCTSRTLTLGMHTVLGHYSHKEYPVCIDGRSKLHDTNTVDHKHWQNTELCWLQKLSFLRMSMHRTSIDRSSLANGLHTTKSMTFYPISIYPFGNGTFFGSVSNRPTLFETVMDVETFKMLGNVSPLPSNK